MLAWVEVDDGLDDGLDEGLGLKVEVVVTGKVGVTVCVIGVVVHVTIVLSFVDGGPDTINVVAATGVIEGFTYDAQRTTAEAVAPERTVRREILDTLLP